VDRLRFQACGLGKPLRRPSGRSAQQAFHTLSTQDHQARVDERSFAHTWAPRDDHGTFGENRFQRIALAGSKRLARPPLAPCDRLFAINRRVDRRCTCQPLDPCRDAFLRPPEMRQEDQGLAVDLLQQQRAACKHLRQGLLAYWLRHLQQLRRRELELREWQGAVTVRGRFQQHVVDARPRPVERVSRNPDLLRDLVGSGEADSVDVLRQHVGIVPHLLDRLLAVGLEDSHRSAGTHAVAVQEQHDFADLPCLLPCVRNPLPALGADAIDRLQFGGSVLDHGENFDSETPDQLPRKNRPNALDQAAAEVPLDPLDGGRRHRLHGGRLELQPVLFVPDPLALRAQPFPGSDRGQRSDDGRLLSMSLCFNPEDTEAVFVIVEGDALDDAGDFLRRRSAFRDCCIHAWGFIFPRDGLPCVTYPGRRPARDWLPRAGTSRADIELVSWT
jgi:hypothetical protein